MRRVAVILCLQAAIGASGTARAEFTLWTGAPLPTDPTTLPLVDQVTHSIFHHINEPTDPVNDKFFHGAAIIGFQGKLYTSFANSLINENSSSERMRGRMSVDGGLTWSSVSVIAPDPDGPTGPDRRSHGSFFDHNGELWAFPSRFGTGTASVQFRNLTLEAVRLKNDGTWENMGTLSTDSWSLDEPKQLANGKWIMGGVDSQFRAAVTISSGTNMTADGQLLPWTTVKLPIGANDYSETTVLAEGNSVMAIMRNGSGPTAAVSKSVDGGMTWSQAEPSNYPMTASKPFAGVLSTGQRFLISNMGENRNTLVIAVGDPFEETFNKVWRITDGVPPPPEVAGSAKGAQWSYPCAYEQQGNLYVVYSQSKEEGAMAVFPINSVTTAAPLGPLRLSVDRRTGQVKIINPGGAAFDFDGYLVRSAGGALTSTGWSSFQDSGQPGWTESNPTSKHLGELSIGGQRSIGAGQSINLGSAYAFTPTALGQKLEDVAFEYHAAGGQTLSGKVEYTGLQNNVVLLVDPATGKAAIQNQSIFNLNVDGYLITSTASALNPAAWTSFQDSGQTGWTESNPTAKHLGELNLGSSRFLGQSGAPLAIGSPFTVGGAQDLTFEYRLSTGETMDGIVQYGAFSAGGNANFDADSDVDGNDFLIWQRRLGAAGGQGDANGDGVVNGLDLAVWKQQFGASAVQASIGAPEPGAMSMAIAAILFAHGVGSKSRAQQTLAGSESLCS